MTPTPVQAGSIPPALEGKDVLGTAQTGTGKTLAFLVPIIEKLLKTSEPGIQALVLLPTRELAMQVFETLLKVYRGPRVMTALVVGGLSEYRQLQDIKKGARIIIATPGRLDDYIKRRLVNLSQVKTLVLDEADRMVDMGFLPQMKNIMNGLSKERQTMCFAATLDKSVAHLVHDYLKNPVRVQIGPIDKPAQGVKLQAYEVLPTQKISLLEHLLKEQQGTCLIFTRTKHGAEKLGRKLIQSGLNVSIIHGGRSQSQRNMALAGFKNGRHRVLVATDVASRGIHVSNIAHVINFDLPQTPQDFIHRVGRTGRVQQTGVAWSFVTPQDRYQFRMIERVLGTTIARVPLPPDLKKEASASGSFNSFVVPQRSGERRPRAQGGYKGSFKRFTRFPKNRRHQD